MSERQYGIDHSMVWLDLENNKEHLKKDGEHYVADATLLRDNLSLRRENERLRDENARLRSCLSDDAENARQIMGENEKLRELLVDAYGYINHPADASWTHMRRKEARDSINGRMRELGVEVPE